MCDCQSLGDCSSDNNINALILPIIQEVLTVMSNVAKIIHTLIIFSTSGFGKKMSGSPVGKSPNKERNFQTAYE